MNKKIQRHRSREFHKIHKIFTNSFQTEFILRFPSRNLRNSRYTRNFRWKISSIETHRDETLKPNISSLVVSRRCWTFCPTPAFSISVLLRAFPRCTLSCTARERGRGTFTLHLRRTKILTVDDTSVLLNKFDAFAPAPLITISGRNLARDATMLFLNQWME